ncbi:interferon-induced transmembrane protein 2-like isoform 2-T2 [Pholidichthys leucotaenia]
MSSGKAAVISTSPPPYEALQPLPAQGYPPQEYPQQYGGAQYGQQTYPMAQPYLGQPGVVHVQPIMYVTQTHLSDPVDDYLWYSIFTMLCCLPLGIAALIYSILTRDANRMGDRLAAQRSSRTARTLNHMALGIGIGVIVLLIVSLVIFATVN